jgi:hypothetical protein
MSDLLTHWAVCEDGLNLLKFDPRIESIFKTAVAREPVMARYGSIVRTEGTWVHERLMEMRGFKPGGLSDGEARRAAFTAAALTHTACDHLMKPSYQRVVEEHDAAGLVPTALAVKEVQRDVYAYQDTFVYKEVLGDGRGEPLGRHMFADIDNPATEALNEAAAAVFTAGILELREMYPDASGFDREVIGDLTENGLRRMIVHGDGAPRTCGSRGLHRKPFVDWMVARKEQGGPYPVNDREALVEEVLPLLTPDAADPLARLDHRLCAVQWLYVQHHRLEDAYLRRSAAKEKRYNIHPDFYDFDDPILKLAAAARKGEAVDADALVAATEEGANRSYYGQAVALALVYIVRAGAVVRGEIDDFEAENHIDHAYMARMRAKPGGHIMT